MSFRNFTDEDFQALLPPHLRISKKAKKKKKTRAKQEGAEAALQVEESRSAIKTKKKKDKDDDASSEGDEGEDELTTELTVDLVDSRDVEGVLETIERVKGRFRLSSINVATALHKIVTLSMSEARRLKYAMQCDVAELVASAMELLPECNAQGVSNIAWAISKIGGHLLYHGEMEIIARAAVAKVDEFNPQNIANVAGTFASMQHSSPALFEKLLDAASRGVSSTGTGPASLGMAQPLDSFLESLDAALQQNKVLQSSVKNSSKNRSSSSRASRGLMLFSANSSVHSFARRYTRLT
ncbi:hypothetical protein SELMODRAFT_412577 [Selaginella moellendorffii]|uniref:Uncharacterized protein n=1 Tax=Selaginella moellendorffii TaxID=88036 RepID=D8RLX9_SELML|nr:hypothetical protein SELMODRAFT_412577 [Selaginella moellendorffii]